MRLASPLLLLFAVLLLACSGLRVRTDFDPSVDFVRYESFSWLEAPLREEPAEGGPAADPFTHNSLVDQRVRSTVEATLAQRGFRKADEGRADFQLRYAIVRREIQRNGPVFVSSGGYGYRHPYAYGSTGFYGPSAYQEGTLILDVIDPATQRIAWRGWASTRTRDGHIDAKRLERTVLGILEKFPPDRGGSRGEG